MIRGDRIEELLKARGWSQAELARRVGVQPTSIWKLISGHSLGSKHLHVIARELGTTPEYLSGETDDPDARTISDHRVPFRSQPPERDPDMVDIAEIDLAFGLGAAFMDQEIVEQQAKTQSFPRAWLRMITASPPSQLYWARGMGNSMEPAIGDGDILLIDRSQITLSYSDLLWAFAYGQHGMVKRLRAMPDGSVKILSDNPSVPPEIAYDGEVHIFGRVVAVVKRL